jgi:7-cyano-7-deazaguanine synthase
MVGQEDTRRAAVVLLSGGLDSATVAAWLQREGFHVIALTVDYGQRQRAELAAAEASTWCCRWTCARSAARP